MPVLEITNNEKEIFCNNNLFMIDFFASWCNPCKILSPIIEEIGRKENITIYKCNIDKNQALTTNFHIMSVPTLVFVKNGKELTRLTGVHNKHELLSEYYNLLNENL